MKFYQNIKHIASLLTLTGIITLTLFSVTALAKPKASSKAKATTTEITTEVTTEATTEVTTEATTEVYTKAYGSIMTPEEVTVYKILKNTPSTYKTGTVNAVKPIDSHEINELYTQSQRTFNFANGDKFNIVRYEFNNTDDNATITKSLGIPGSTIEIRYVNDDNNWYMSTNPANTAKKTMFIDTDKCSIIVSIPAVYKNTFTNNTLTAVPEMESPITITRTEGGYNLMYTLPASKNYIGEIWYLYSNNKLANWQDINHFNILNVDLHTKSRFSYDGYYYPTPYNYNPGGDNVYYRQPSNYTALTFVKYGSFPATNELGYAFMYTSMLNQNSQGYWATGPYSDWLYTDFKIANNFYDTRFNSDFAGGLLEGYKRYGNTEFLEAAVKYGEYFKKHITNHGYTTKNGGLFAEDYGSFSGNHSKTHVSLNHQLAEMNYLYELYNITGEQSYYDLAELMLKAIEDTREQWVLHDNNLNYALHYTGTYNVMRDYPYLTYNDLYDTKKLLNTYFNKNNATIDYLMACKLNWMQSNRITGYKVD